MEQQELPLDAPAQPALKVGDEVRAYVYTPQRRWPGAPVHNHIGVRDGKLIAYLAAGDRPGPALWCHGGFTNRTRGSKYDRWIMEETFYYKEGPPRTRLITLTMDPRTKLVPRALAG